VEIMTITVAATPATGRAMRQFNQGAMIDAAKECHMEPDGSALNRATTPRWKTSDACISGFISAAASFSVTVDISAR
jgi:hypothetical protein